MIFQHLHQEKSDERNCLLQERLKALVHIHSYLEWLAVFGKRRREPVPGAKGKRTLSDLAKSAGPCFSLSFSHGPNRQNASIYLMDEQSPLPEDTFGYFVENFISRLLKPTRPRLQSSPSAGAAGS